MWSTVGCVWPPLIRLLTGRPVETTRDPAEICVARICREAGARVKKNPLLCDLNIVVPVTDQRRIEVIANGLLFWGGKWSRHCLVGVLRGEPLETAKPSTRLRTTSTADTTSWLTGAGVTSWCWRWRQGGGPTKESRSSNHWLGTSPCRCRGFCAVPPRCCSSNAGQPCWRAPFSAASLLGQLRERACCLFGRTEQGSVR